MDVAGVDVAGVDPVGVVSLVNPFCEFSLSTFSIAFLVQSASGLAQIVFPSTVRNLQFLVGY